LGRRIERSPLSFAWHRWVSDRTPPDIDIAEHARPCAELSEWADERAQLPIDAELGLDLTPGRPAIYELLGRSGVGSCSRQLKRCWASRAILTTHRRVHALDCTRCFTVVITSTVRARTNGTGYQMTWT
jgi:hypothetical protein